VRVPVSRGEFSFQYVCVAYIGIWGKSGAKRSSFHCVFGLFWIPPENWWKRWESAMRAVHYMGFSFCYFYCSFHLFLFCSVLFCSYNACVTLHHDPARSKSDLLVQTCWNRRGRRSLLRIYISLGPGIPREKEHGRYITHTVQFELHNLPVSIKLVFRLIL
jgi:hypothetical protein